MHFQLTSFGVSKKQREDFDRVEANKILQIVKDKILHAASNEIL